MIQTWRKKPVIIHTIQYTGDNSSEIIEWANGNIQLINSSLIVKTLEGNMVISINDFVIKGVQEEFYSCKEDIFYKTYERA